jgi:hypothetical protein
MVQMLPEGHCADVGMLPDCFRFSCAPANVIVVGIVCGSGTLGGLQRDRPNRTYGMFSVVDGLNWLKVRLLLSVRISRSGGMRRCRTSAS